MNNQWSDWNAAPPEPKQEEFLIPLELQKILEHHNYPLNRDGILMLWEKSKKDLEQAKIFEMDIRKLAVKATFNKPKEGTNTIEIGAGYKAKSVIKYNYSLASNEIVEACLDRISKIGNQGSFIADRLVSWKPNFLLTEYRQLQEEAEKGDLTSKQILKEVSTMLTISEAAPTLEIVEPKVKKK